MDAFSKLVEAGADVRSTNHKGETCLYVRACAARAPAAPHARTCPLRRRRHVAVRAGLAEVAATAAGFGCPVNAIDDSGVTAIALAERAGFAGARVACPPRRRM